MRAFIVFAVIACAAAQNSTDPVLPPVAWPVQHEHLEMMFTIDAQTLAEKPIWYDYENLHYRADVYLTSGVGFKNESSYWLGDVLSIYTFDLDNCVNLNLGFGMMRPDWFIDDGAVTFGGVYATQRTSPLITGYKYVALTRKDGAGQGFFDYYSDNTTGAAFLMSAPSPAGFVVNEYIVPPSPVTFAADSPIFTLPAGIPCINTTLAAGLIHPGGLNEHLRDLLRNPTYNMLPEIWLRIQAVLRGEQ